jgi:hypothetical protein
MEPDGGSGAIERVKRRGPVAGAAVVGCRRAGVDALHLPQFRCRYSGTDGEGQALWSNRCVGSSETALHDSPRVRLTGSVAAVTPPRPVAASRKSARFFGGGV